MGHGAEQRAESSERVWTDDVAIVVEQGELRGHLATEHREVILPEVGHHLLELVVTRHRAGQLGAVELLHPPVAERGHRLKARAILRREGVARRVGELELLAEPTNEDVLLRARVDELAGGQGDDGIARQHTVGGRVAPVLRGELAHEPMVDSLLHDGCGFTRPRTIGEALEELLRLLVHCQLARLVTPSEHRFRHQWPVRPAGAGGETRRENDQDRVAPTNGEACDHL